MTVSALIYKYPLDLTGKNPTNLVIREPHSIGAAGKRAIVTNSGPFFTKDLVVREAVSGKILEPYTQYLILQPYQEASVKTGLDVAAIIYITDLNVDTEILVDYQCVGGEFSWSVFALKAMIEELDLDSRPIHWGDIVGKPSEFRPSPHLHDLGDSYGWEYIAWQLEGVRSAILLGDAASHDELRQQLQLSLDVIRNEAGALRGELVAHMADKTNSHAVTALQVGLGNVLNIRHATAAEASNAANITLTAPTTNYIISTSSLAAAMRQFNTSTVVPHLNNISNPHSVTKAQVGLGSVSNFTFATNVESEQGLVENKYMNPLRTKEAIAQLALVPLTAHINTKTGNPHDVTKAEVGLGLVANYAHATGAESTNAGLLNYAESSYTNNVMGVYAVAIALRSFNTTTIQPHIVDKFNPHAVTKAQVGLGNVANYRIATDLEAQQGTSNILYMTPLTSQNQLAGYTSNYLDYRYATKVELNAHLNGPTNPHGTTKTDIGLSTIPDAISNARNLNSAASLATSKAIFDHTGSADHDGRYIPANTGISGSIHIREDLGNAYIWLGGGWKQIWPPLWQ
jgi:hypothetical protein